MARKDVVTLELPGVAKKPGRPPTRPQDKESLKAAARARQKAYRERLAAQGKESLTCDLPADVMAALRKYVARQNADVSGEPITLGDAVERVLRDRLLRPR
jgi:hypothetical protein